jgi:hypothetical protein
MTNRQRAFTAAIVFTVRNRRFFNWHRIGVRDIESGKDYEFHGQFMPRRIDLQDEKYNKMTDSSFIDSAALEWGAKIDFIAKRGTDTIELRLYDKSITFEGKDGDYYRFEGRYYVNAEEVEISDYSQDKRRYTYRITW